MAGTAGRSGRRGWMGYVMLSVAGTTFACANVARADDTVKKKEEAVETVRVKTAAEVYEAKMQAELDLSAQIDEKTPALAPESTTANDKKVEARDFLRKKVLASDTATLGQKRKALDLLGEGGTITSFTYGVGAWFERNFDRIDVNVFQPKARIYFDSGSDDPGEIDLFRNGAVVPTIDVTEVRLLNYVSSARKTVAGLTFSGGIGAPATSADGSATGASTAPVLLASAGFIIAHQLDEGDPKKSSATIGFEAGYTLGITTDETFADTTDGAWYVGFGVQIKF